MSTKLCECGCGQPAPIATKTATRLGHVKGQPVRFIHGHGARKPERAPCSVTGCGRPVNAQGLCGTHYARQRKGLPLDTPVAPRTPQRGACAEEGCDQPAHAKGLCKPHYHHSIRATQAAAEGRTLRPYGWQPPICTEDDCDKPTHANGLCRMHWTRWRRNGTTADPRELYRTGELIHPNRRYPHGAVCAVDGCGRPRKSGSYCIRHYARLRYQGDLGLDTPIRQYGEGGSFINENGYRVIYGPGGQKLEHRIVMEQILGRPLRSFESAHHKNLQRDDNAPSNLELWVTPQPTGARLVDLIDWMLENYRDEVTEALTGTYSDE